MSKNTVSRFEMTQLTRWAFGPAASYTEQDGMGHVHHESGQLLCSYAVEPGAPKLGRKLIGRAIMAAKVEQLQAAGKPARTWHPWVIALCAFFGFDLAKAAGYTTGANTTELQDKCADAALVSVDYPGTGDV